MCLFSRLLKNKKYTKTKKNKGAPPPMFDKRVEYVAVSCGRCMECQKKRARDWQVRLMEEIKYSRNGRFVTFTFSDKSIAELKDNERCRGLEGYALDNAIAKVGTRYFLERWRKKYGVSVRHWLVTELGHNGTENIHMHGILWTDVSLSEIEQLWNYGFMHKEWKKGNYVDGSTVSYITKYITKRDEKHKHFNAKVFTSAGIGRGYVGSSAAKRNAYAEGLTKETYRTDSGSRMSMPTYWRNKLYSEAEREKLWLEKLDKGERWVCGEMVKAEDVRSYDRLLEYYREINRRLGYGDDSRNWDEEAYEKARRTLLMETRIKRAEKSLAAIGSRKLAPTGLAGNKAGNNKR